MISVVSAPFSSVTASSSRLGLAWNYSRLYLSFSMERHYSTRFEGPLISASQLKKAVTSNTPPVILDCTWFMPNVPRNGYEEFLKSRIPGARFFNLDEISDKSSPYPHMLPTAEHFAKAMGTSCRCAWLISRGIGDHTTICCYDSQGIFSSPRVWWTFKVFGHQQVAVLNGGLPAWQRAGGELETSAPKKYPPTTYPVPEKDESLVRSFEDITDIVRKDDGSVQILDARSAGRFLGIDPEPRKGLSSGHVPGSISLPFQKVIDPVTGEFVDREQLRDLFNTLQLDSSKDTITSCGTGVTASILYLALEASGYPGKKSIYDGSWTEYATRNADNPDMIAKSNEK